jgi:hypothetical protein
VSFSFFARDRVLDCVGSRFRVKRLPMRGTSGSVRRSPANPARPGREQRYRDRFECRGVPEVPLICRTQENSQARYGSLAGTFRVAVAAVARLFRGGDFLIVAKKPPPLKRRATVRRLSQLGYCMAAFIRGAGNSLWLSVCLRVLCVKFLFFVLQHRAQGESGTPRA